jgi:hypoxanthine phosphoribosyltransferase
MVIFMENDIKKVLYTHEQIVEKCVELGAQITADYQGRDSNLMLVGLLRGSVPFMAELMMQIKMHVETDFMDVSSYDGMESTGDIKILKDLDSSVKGRDVLIVEDIIDTGRTLQTVMEMLRQRGATSVKVVSLLDKPEGRKVELEGDYIGFTIPKEFVVGYGLDFNELYRNLPFIGVLKEEVYS